MATNNPYLDRQAAQDQVARQNAQQQAIMQPNQDVQSFAQGKQETNTSAVKPLVRNLFANGQRPQFVGVQRVDSSKVRINGLPATTAPQQNTKPQEQEKQEPSKTDQGNKQYSGGGDSSTKGPNYLAGLFTTPRQEEELRKASVARQRILAIGDIGRHIANMVGTVNGSTPMQFNSPVGDERKRYLQEKAVRDQNNLRYMNYQQMKAAQDQKMRQFEYQIQKDSRDFELKKKESDARANLNEARIQRQQSLAALDEARLKGQISRNQYQELMNKYYPDIAESKIRETESRIAKNGRTGTGGSGRRGSSIGSKGMDEYTVTSKTTYDTDPVTGQRRGSTTTKTRTVKRPDGSSSSFTTTNKKPLPGQKQKPEKKKLPGKK